LDIIPEGDETLYFINGNIMISASLNAYPETSNLLVSSWGSRYDGDDSEFRKE
jgi:hypothetical protein